MIPLPRPVLPAEAVIVWTGGEGLTTYAGDSPLGVAARRRVRPVTAEEMFAFTDDVTRERNRRNKAKARQRQYSMSLNAQTLRAWREANPEKYAAQKQRQNARRAVLLTGEQRAYCEDVLAHSKSEARRLEAEERLQQDADRRAAILRGAA